MSGRRVPSLGPHALRASGDRWLFGYADVVTLLFACFAALYAAKLTPPMLDIRLPDPPAPAAVPAAPAPSPLEQALERVLGHERTLPGIDVATGTRGLTISLPEAGSFPPGRAELSDAARGVMLDLARELQPLPNQIRVEGHTDDVPIHTALFASNWELSTARATTVVRFLIEAGGLDPARLAAAGYAEYRPKVDNDTPESRARNRRVDIVVLDPDIAAHEEPAEVR
jgi:chemotaxis protein MotB